MKLLGIIQYTSKAALLAICTLLSTAPFAFSQTIETPKRLTLEQKAEVASLAPEEEGLVQAVVSGKVEFINADGFFRLSGFPDLLYLHDVRPIAKNSFDLIKGWNLDCIIYDFKIGDPTPPRKVICTGDKASTYGLSLLLLRKKVAVRRVS